MLSLLSQNSYLILNLSLLQLPLICCLDFEFLVFGVDVRVREFVEFLKKKPKLVCSMATTALAFKNETLFF